MYGSLSQPTLLYPFPLLLRFCVASPPSTLHSIVFLVSTARHCRTTDRSPSRRSLERSPPSSHLAIDLGRRGIPSPVISHSWTFRMPVASAVLASSPLSRSGIPSTSSSALRLFARPLPLSFHWSGESKPDRSISVRSRESTDRHP